MNAIRFAELDRLTTEELRQEAFMVARRRHDARFFWDLFRHLPHAPAAEQLDGSPGAIGTSLDDAIGLWREFTGHAYGENEGVIRASFIDYLMTHAE